MAKQTKTKKRWMPLDAIVSSVLRLWCRTGCTAVYVGSQSSMRRTDGWRQKGGDERRGYYQVGGIQSYGGEHRREGRTDGSTDGQMK